MEAPEERRKMAQSLLVKCRSFMLVALTGVVFAGVLLGSVGIEEAYARSMSNPFICPAGGDDRFSCPADSGSGSGGGGTGGSGSSGGSGGSGLQPLSKETYCQVSRDRWDSAAYYLSKAAEYRRNGAKDLADRTEALADRDLATAEQAWRLAGGC